MQSLQAPRLVLTFFSHAAWSSSVLTCPNICIAHISCCHCQSKHLLGRGVLECIVHAQAAQTACNSKPCNCTYKQWVMLHEHQQAICEGAHSLHTCSCTHLILLQARVQHCREEKARDTYARVLKHELSGRRVRTATQRVGAGSTHLGAEHLADLGREDVRLVKTLQRLRASSMSQHGA